MASSIFSGMEDFGLGDMSTKDIFRDPAAEEKKKKEAEQADSSNGETIEVASTVNEIPLILCP